MLKHRKIEDDYQRQHSYLTSHNDGPFLQCSDYNMHNAWTLLVLNTGKIKNTVYILFKKPCKWRRLGELVSRSLNSLTQYLVLMFSLLSNQGFP